MNIQLIDRVLDTAITGLIYGSEVWLGCALAWYVMGRKKQAVVQDVGLVAVGGETDGRMRPKIPVNLSRVVSAAGDRRMGTEASVKGRITIDITPAPVDLESVDLVPVAHVPASKASGAGCLVVREPIAVTVRSVQAVIAPVSLVSEPRPFGQKLLERAVIERAVIERAVIERPLLGKVQSQKYALKPVVEQSSLDFSEAFAEANVPAAPPVVASVSVLPVEPSVEPPVEPPAEPPVVAHAIACEPINWKQWKVADLRQASLAKSFGVSTRVEGSRRNLPKADLIAQYEENLAVMVERRRA